MYTEVYVYLLLISIIEINWTTHDYQEQLMYAFRLCDQRSLRATLTTSKAHSVQCNNDEINLYISLV